METPRTTIAPEPNTAYVWEVPGRPVAVHLEFEVIDQMMPDILRAFSAVPRRGLETGGILLGNIRTGSPMIVHVTGFEITPCEHVHGPSFVLSDRDRKGWKHAYERAHPSPDGRPFAVGYFRSHTREGLTLADEDAAMMEQFFPPPYGIALLIKPFASRASQAGFFIYEQDELQRETSYLEFPFRSNELPASAPDPSSTLILPRREQDRPPVVPVAPAVVEQAPPAPAPPLAAAEPPSITEPLIRRHQPEAPDFLPFEREARNSGWRKWTAVGGLSLLLLGLAAFAGFQVALHPPAGTGWVLPLYSVALAANPLGENIHLTWDRRSWVIRSAQRGVLTITDGTAQRQVELTAPQLRNGSLVYRRLSTDISLKLEVFTSERNSITEVLQLRLPKLAEPPDNANSP